MGKEVNYQENFIYTDTFFPAQETRRTDYLTGGGIQHFLRRYLVYREENQDLRGTNRAHSH